jgi:NAD(P)-dependent dehydrogenase (short-subunit alcohol dehydrogenase family)
MISRKNRQVIVIIIIISKRGEEIMPKSVLVSGASSGIGKALCLELDHQGYQVFAGIRKTPDGEAIRSQASERLVPVLLDVTQPETIASARQAVTEKTDGQLFGLVNNAGIDVSGALEFLPIQEFRNQMEVNLIGQLALTQACLPMLRKGNGRIIFISSVAGRLVTPFNGPYAASKAALVAMADALRLELSAWNIIVSVLIVGSVQTPIWEKSARQAGEILRCEPSLAWELYGKLQKRAGKFYQQTGRNGMSVEKLVAIIQDVLEARRPKEYILAGYDALMIELIAKLLPVHWRDWLVKRQMGLPTL